MLDIDQVLNNGAINRTYSLKSISDGKSIRGDATASTAEPRTLTVSHSLRNPKDPSSPVRHLVRLDATQLNAVTAVPEQMSLYAVMEIPQTATFTNVEADALKNELVNFLVGSSSAMFNKWLNSEP
jgi:hypothetical protein